MTRSFCGLFHTFTGVERHGEELLAEILRKLDYIMMNML